MELILDIKQLGPVKDSQVIWRPLTVFIGPNNSGKTYTAYLIYGILTTIPFNFGLEEKKIKELFYKGKIRLSFETIKKKWIKAWQKQIKDYLIPTFWEQYFAIENSTPIIEIIGFQPEILKEVKVKESLGIGSPSFEARWLLGGVLEYTASLVKEEEFLYISILNQEKYFLENEISNQDIEEEIKYINFQVPFCRAFAKLLGLPLQHLVIPAERTAFLFYKQWFVIKDRIREIFRKLQVSKIRQKEPLRIDKNILDIELERMLSSVLEDVSFPKIFEDFLSFLLLIERKKTTKVYEKVISLLEKKLLKGKILIQNENFWFDYGQGNVEISGASSGVKALLPLEKFLKISHKGALLVIDEPEMHLHPEAQVILAIAIAIAVNLGLRVLLTTHSPYILDTFNFLAWAHQIREKIKKIGNSSLEEKFKKILETSPFDVPEEALIDPAHLSTYFFRNDGRIEDIKKISQETLEVDIDWTTFSQISESLWEILEILGELKDEILEKE